MPTRQRSEPTVSISLPRLTTLNGSPVFSGSFVAHEVSKSMTDVVTPNFDKRRDKGELFFNPCLLSVTERFNSAPGSAQITAPAGVYLYTGTGSMTQQFQFQAASNFKFVNIVVPPPSYDIEQACKQRAIAQIDPTPYALLEDVFEIRKTLEFMRDPLSSLRRLTETFTGRRRILREKFSRIHLHTQNRSTAAKQIAEDLADIELTYRFAVSPLLRSVHNLYQGMITPVTRKSRATARASESYQFNKDEYQYKPSAVASFRYGWNVTVRYSIDAKASILYEVTNPVVDWRYTYGLRAKDIPETIWAVMPYSFIVDRMFNVSDGVRGLTNLLDPQVKIKGASVTIRTDTTRTSSFREYIRSSYTVNSLVPDVDTSHTFEYKRVVWDPSPNDTWPPVQVKGLISDATKITDSIALITKLLLGTNQ